MSLSFKNLKEPLEKLSGIDSTFLYFLPDRYIWGGAFLFSTWESWDMLDSSYFCFVSLSTIGFGDIVPGEKIYSEHAFDLSFILCSMYLMLGKFYTYIYDNLHLLLFIYKSLF